MHYEKYKIKMHQSDMNLGEQIHGLNLLCAANLSNHELRIAMREKQQKNLSKCILAVLQYQIVLPVNQVITYLTRNTVFSC